MWRSGRQTVISLSTAESELIALLDGAVATLGVEALLQDVGMQISTRIVNTDSTSALAISTGTGGWRTRHLRIKAGWMQEQLDAETFSIQHCAGKFQRADLLTKPLAAQRIGDLLSLWGVVEDVSLPTVAPSSSRIAARALLALVCCLLVTGVKAEQVSGGGALSVDWDMLGWLLVLLIAGVVAVWEALKWLRSGMVEWTGHECV